MYANFRTCHKYNRNENSDTFEIYDTCDHYGIFDNHDTHDMFDNHCKTEIYDRYSFVMRRLIYIYS